MIGRGLLAALAAVLLGGTAFTVHAPATKTVRKTAQTQQVRIVRPLILSGPAVNDSTNAQALGNQVMKSVAKGHMVAGVVLRRSATKIWVRTGTPLHPSTESFVLSAGTVTWQGGWTFLGSQTLRNMPVNLVVQHRTVVGVLTYRNAYGRVVRSQGGWVTIAAVKGAKHSNPACRRPTGPLVIAKILKTTVWNSRKNLLPRHSLVQFTVYGVPGYPVLLGGVEDYGRAVCPTPKPAGVRLLLNSL
jgi:hypothetical protein